MSHPRFALLLPRSTGAGSRWGRETESGQVTAPGDPRLAAPPGPSTDYSWMSEVGLYFLWLMAGINLQRWYTLCNRACGGGTGGPTPVPGDSPANSVKTPPPVPQPWQCPGRGSPGQQPKQEYKSYLPGTFLHLARLGARDLYRCHSLNLTCSREFPLSVAT